MVDVVDVAGGGRMMGQTNVFDIIQLGEGEVTWVNYIACN